MFIDFIIETFKDFETIYDLAKYFYEMLLENQKAPPTNSSSSSDDEEETIKGYNNLNILPTVFNTINAPVTITPPITMNLEIKETDDEEGKRRKTVDDEVKEITNLFTEFSMLQLKHQFSLFSLLHFNDYTEEKKYTITKFHKDITPELFTRGLPTRTINITEYKELKVLNFLNDFFNLIVSKDSTISSYNTITESSVDISGFNTMIRVMENNYQLMLPYYLPISQSSFNIKPVVVCLNLQGDFINNYTTESKFIVADLLSSSISNIIVNALVSKIFAQFSFEALVLFITATCYHHGVSDALAQIEKEWKGSNPEETSYYDTFIYYQKMREIHTLLDKVASTIAKLLKPEIKVKDVITMIYGDKERSKIIRDQIETKWMLKNYERVRKELAKYPFSIGYVITQRKDIEYINMGVETLKKETITELSNKGTQIKTTTNSDIIQTKSILGSLNLFKRRIVVKDGIIPALTIKKDGVYSEHMTIPYDHKVATINLNITSWQEAKKISKQLSLNKEVKIKSKVGEFIGDGNCASIFSKAFNYVNNSSTISASINYNGQNNKGTLRIDYIDVS